MKPILTLVFRDKRIANHSMERLFAAMEPDFSKHYDLHKVVVPRQPSGLRALLENIAYARKHVEGVVHVTGDAQYLVPFLPRGRTILTIHDCGYLEKLSGLKKFLYKWIWFKLPCWAAAKVTVISKATQEVLEREIGDLGTKLTLVENCVTLDMGLTQRPFDAARPRILLIGTGYHKNPDNLFEAIRGLSCQVHLVGKLGELDRARAEEYSIDLVEDFAVSDERLKEIFHSVDILFFASRYEGFGLPILEGQSVGIPVITSNRLSMPWVAGDAALIVEPESPSEIRAAIEVLMTDREVRQALVQNGFENLKRFKPSAIADKYMCVYDLVTKMKPVNKVRE